MIICIYERERALLHMCLLQDTEQLEELQALLLPLASELADHVQKSQCGLGLCMDLPSVRAEASLPLLKSFANFYCGQPKLKP